MKDEESIIKNKGGRPKKNINWKRFNALCQIQCTEAEIAAVLDISVDTIERAVLRDKGVGFAEYYEEKRHGGRMSLRRKQFELALLGNPTMLIWLGKQYLEQSEKQTIIASIKKIESEQDIKKLTNEQLLLEIEKINKE
jgi:hypothetical protein